MISLNLLGQETKRRLKQFTIFFTLKNITFIISSVLLICALSFGFVYILLQNNIKSLESQIQQETELQRQEKITSTETAIKLLNEQLTRAHEIQLNYVEWPLLINQIFSKIPNGIQMSDIQLDSVSKMFKISGIARDRTELLSLQSQLSLVTFLSNMTQPSTNLAQKENIIFEITANLNVQSP